MTASTDNLPVDTFKEAATYLRRPFTAQAVRFKVQAQWKTGGLIVCYIDARLVAERLNKVCPHLWFDEYRAVDEKRLMCKLTVENISRRDVGEGYVGKGLYSDAFKRAAVKFGVGVSLYAVPKTIFNVSDGFLKVKDEKVVGLSDQGTARARELYAAWLSMAGKEGYGEPLDHGDVEDSAGDLDAEQPPVDEPDAPATTDRLLTTDERQTIHEFFSKASVDLREQQTFLTAIGVDSIDTLTRAKAFELRKLLDERAARSGTPA